MMTKKEEMRFLEMYEYDDSGENYEYVVTQHLNAYDLEEWKYISPEIKYSIFEAMSKSVRYYAAQAALEEKKYELLKELHGKMMKKYREDVGGLIEIIKKFCDIEGQTLYSLPKKTKDIKTTDCQRNISDIKKSCERFCGKL